MATFKVFCVPEKILGWGKCANHSSDHCEFCVYNKFNALKRAHYKRDHWKSTDKGGRHV